MTLTALPGAVRAVDDVPFHRASIDEDDVDAVADVLRSGWLTTGRRCREFEDAFAQSLGGGVTALAVNSCTSALHLAFEAMGVGPGDVVLTSPYTFTATAEVLRYLGAHPMFADVDPTTGALTVEGVLRALDQAPTAARDRIRAVAPVHFAGRPCDLTGLGRVAHEQGWGMVDDAAHAIPAAHRGVPVGRWGTATAFSFYATKSLCTGEGGMVVTSDDALAQRMRTMRLHGIDRDAFARYSQHDSWRYEVVAPGFKYNLTDVAAALGISQLRRQADFRARRAAVAEAYTQAFRSVPGLQPPPDAARGDEHAWHLYALRVLDGPSVRDELVRQLAAVGVGTSVHFIPLHLQPYYRDAYGLARGDFPGAEELFDSEISLPLFPDLTDAQVDRVVTVLPGALARARARSAR
jgi:dTDP-4-amino-4,6-dideoxygalactose transaminase